MSGRTMAGHRWLPLLVVLVAIAPFVPAVARPSGVFATSHSDVLSQDLPWREYISSELARTGSVPTWNPGFFAGLPVLESPTIPVFYPPYALFLAGAPHRAYAILFALHLAWMALGTFFLARALGVGPGGAAFAALAFSLGARVMGHLYAGHLVIVAEVAWIPWALLLVHSLGDAPRRALPLALVFGAMLLSGHPQLFLYTVLVGGIWVLFAGRDEARSGRLFRAIPAYVAAVAGGIACAAVQLWPSFLYSGQMGRAGGVPFEFAGYYSLDPRSLLALVLPLPLGHPEAGNYWGPPNYWERCAYVGVPVLLLAGAGLARAGSRRVRVLLAALFVALVLFAMGPRTPLFPLMFEFVPGLDYFRVPARAMIFAALVAALLAGRGVDSVRDAIRGGPGRRLLPAIAVLLVVAALAWIAAGERILETGRDYVRRVYESDQGATGHSRPIEYWLAQVDLAYGTLRAGLVALAGLVLAVALAVRLRSRGRIGPGLVSAILVILVLAEAYYTGVRFLGWRDLTGQPRVPEIVADLEPTAGRHRVLDQADAIPLSVAVRQRIERVGGYDPMIPGRYLEYVAGMVGRDWEPLGTKITAQREAISDDWSRWRLDALGVRYVVTGDDLTPRGFRLVRREVREGAPDRLLFENPDFRPRATLHGTWRVAHDREEAGRILRSASAPVVVLEAETAPPADASGGLAELVLYEPDRIRVETTSAGSTLLVVADSYVDGWTARIDGKPAPIHPANVAFRGVLVPPGEHEVEMTYRPVGVRTGLAVSLVASLGFLAAWIVLARRRRRD